MKLLAIMSILISPALLSCFNANACKCYTIPLKQSIPLYNCIVTGTFIQDDKLWEIPEMNNNVIKYFYPYTGKFIVSKDVKGNNIKDGDTVIISPVHSNCSMILANNRSYLLFANTIEGKLVTSICSHSGLLDDKKYQEILKQTEQYVKDISNDRQTNN